MARQTTSKIGKEVDDAIKEVTATASVKVQEPDERKTMNIVEAMELAGEGKKVVRAGWNKELSNHYVEIPRGHTVPMYTDGKHGYAYQPSMPDVLINDWIEMEEK